MRLVPIGVTLAVLAALASWGGGQLASRGIEGALHGTDLSAAAVAPAGFPLAVGAALDHPAWRSPDGRIDWQGPQARITAPLWSPLGWHADLALPQDLMLDGRRFALTGDGAALALDLGFGFDLPVTGAAAHLAAPALIYEAAAAPSVAARSVDVEARAAQAAGYRVTLRVAALALPPRLAASFAPGANLPDVIDSITADLALGFDRRLALADTTSPVLESIAFDAVDLDWGGRRLSATGKITIDADGRPEGTITIASKDWQDWLQVAEAARLVGRDQIPMLTSLGTYMAAQSSEGQVEVPLAFARGLMSLGPVPLGPAPRLR